MRNYLAESYFAPHDRAALEHSAAAVRAATAELSGEGLAVRYVRTTFLAEDETCFHVFAAESEEAVREASRRAGLELIRVVEAVEPDASGAQNGGMA